MKTIKEIADELGYSKTYIMQTIKKNNLQTSLQKIGNKFVLDKDLENEIINFLSAKVEREFANKSQTRSEENLSYLKAQIEYLKSQIAEKDKQIAEKDKQLDQQQQLTLNAMKDKEELKLQLEAYVTKNNSYENAFKNYETRKKWYQFWK